MKLLLLAALAGVTAASGGGAQAAGGTPDKGVDGNRDGNFGDGSVYYGNSPSSEGTDSNPSTTYFYQVDLGQNNYVNRIQFLPRTAIPPQRLRSRKTIPPAISATRSLRSTPVQPRPAAPMAGLFASHDSITTTG